MVDLQDEARGLVGNADSFDVIVDGQAATAWTGETIAGLLLRIGRRDMRVTLRTGAPRGYFCGMGTCFDCIIDMDGRSLQGCQTYAAAGMQISTRPVSETESQ